MEGKIKWVNGATGVVITLVAVFAAIVSYTHIYNLAVMEHQTGIDPILIPLSVDMLILGSSLGLLYLAWQRLPVPWLVRTTLWAGIVVTVFANVMDGYRYGPLSAAISAWPAAAFVLTVESVMMIARVNRLHPIREAQKDKRWELEHLDDPINPKLDLGQEIILNEMEKRRAFENEVKRIRERPVDKRGGSVAPPNAPIPPISKKLPDPPPPPRRKRDGLSVANIQKAAHCDQKRATRIRDLIRDNGYDMDKAILIDEEAYPRKGKVTNERTDGDM